MLNFLLATFMMFPMIWLTPAKTLWSTSVYHSLLIAVMSLQWLNTSWFSGWTHMNPQMASDPLSAPLLVLSCWLLPLTILASQKQASSNPILLQRTYISLLVLLQFFLILAFSATELLMFYILFESTLIPTLLIITRWGNQAERLTAGTYFLYYTLLTSLPLLIALLLLLAKEGSLSYIISHYFPAIKPLTNLDKVWWIACMLAFMVKLPVYGVHLWLPKAHVEAPIAGSMILAAILLKLGGYGMARLLVILEPLTKEMSYPFIIFALWGVIMAGAMCLRQADLKSLIAYSSVSHMGLVAAGVLIQTPAGLTGALMLMIAHGLTSSTLFCLANTSYERTHTRTLMLIRGLQTLFPLMTCWWLLTCLANLACPPLPNLTGEVMIVSSLLEWSPMTIALTGAGMLITMLYSLFLFLMTQRGPTTTRNNKSVPSYTREHLLITLHLTPLFMLILKPDIISGWTC
uniref:NADH-ubiquinone oxidoreductase chain 4 n=1 Tax=Stegastes flavilatus TaxID=1268094 RepID=A0A0U1Z026_9TELE|nr:NADH dehydrogenase subunit 4 [Stegastes flavilatus]